MMNIHRNTRPASRQGGWNLIELLVVVSIITILLGILINSASEGKGPEEVTKVTMRAAMGAATEYEVSTSQRIDHLTPNINPNTSIARFCYQIWKLDRTKNMLLALGKDAIVQPNADGRFPPSAIVDGWGRQLRYYSGEGAFVGGETGMIVSKAPYLASAGPDGEWGTININTNLPPNATDKANDNMYSNDLK